MKTDSLRINQLTDSDFQWYLTYLTAMDNSDIEAYGCFLADKCSFYFNNDCRATHKKQMIAGLSEYWKSYAALEHELLNIYGSTNAFMLEALNHYTRHDNRRITLKAVALTDRDEAGLVTSVRVYSDVSALFAPA